jgi:hypothetical protein
MCAQKQLWSWEDMAFLDSVCVCVCVCVCLSVMYVEKCFTFPRKCMSHCSGSSPQMLHAGQQHLQAASLCWNSWLQRDKFEL